MSHAYRLATLRLVSDVELPELSPWTGGGDGPTDVVFRLGKLPPSLDAPDRVFAGFQTKGRRQYLTTYRDDARVLVEDGRTVTIELAPGADAAEASSTLMAPVQAVLWHQRGLLPLHASVIGVNGVAVALSGPSGVGKSTLAAALAAGGHEVLADDICIVDAANGADVLPGAARLRLWRDAVDHLNIAAPGMARDKYLVEGGALTGPERDASWPRSCYCRASAATRSRSSRCAAPAASWSCRRWCTCCRRPMRWDLGPMSSPR